MSGADVPPPWARFYREPDASLVVGDATMYEQVAQAAADFPDHTAIIFLGRRISFAHLLEQIERCAAALLASGVRAGDAVTVSMPNVPNAVIMFYALNRIGARAVMTHPLSSPTELKHYLTESGSRWAVTLDLFYPRLADILDDTAVERVLIGSVADYLSGPMKLGFALTKGRKIAPVPHHPRNLSWREFLAGAPTPAPYRRAIEPEATAVVLFSGGTTSMPKGIELSSASFNALAASMRLITGFRPTESVLAILPVFHGFGLGLCVHTPLTLGGVSILVPEFSASVYIDNLIKYRPSFIAGVPTLFQALLTHPKLKKVSFASLRGAYSGGDSLTPELKRRFDAALLAQGSRVELMEGYGLTECVTACTISPAAHYRENSVGIPMPGLLVKVVDAATGGDVAADAEGEICVSGPTLMNGYLNEPEATADTLRLHPDGRIWLHTGDVGSMDADGYVYFRSRAKRIIKVSGVSVYPAQVEHVLETHPAVRRACVVGVPDDYQGHAVHAFVVLDDHATTDPAELIAHCATHLIKWAVPRTITVREQLPTTLVGKIAYTELERELTAG
ncbi:MAG: AMP-binding protein [Propionibacteriales bacterium]|nr:AMP-binding protein [Propionibacteriales bacterium]